MMGKVNKILAAGVLSVLSFGQVAQAMQIPQFDKMDPRDQGDYATLLVKVAYNDLTARGQVEQADKLLSFFEDESGSGGIQQFDKNLDLARALNEKYVGNPNKPVLQVENAMEVTLKHQGIQVDLSTLLASGKNFTPKYPPSGSSGTQR